MKKIYKKIEKPFSKQVIWDNGCLIIEKKKCIVEIETGFVIFFQIKTKLCIKL